MYSVSQFPYICTDAEKYFEMEQQAISQGLPYDYESVMHFRHNEFSLDNQSSTLVPKKERISLESLGRSLAGTDLDYLHLNLLYCDGKIFVK